MYLDLRPAATPGVGLPAAVWLTSTRNSQRFAETSVWPLFDLAGAPNARGLFLGDYHGLVALGDELQALLVLSTQDLSNRNDVFALRVTPALPVAALGAPAGGVATRLSVAPVPVLSAADESAFRARRSAATQAYLAGRLAAVDADAGAVWPRRR